MDEIPRRRDEYDPGPVALAIFVVGGVCILATMLAIAGGMAVGAHVIRKLSA